MGEIERDLREMSDHEESKVESMMEKISEKIKGDDSSSSSSSSSDSETERETTSLKEKVFRIFGREKPVHKVLGGGKRMYFMIIFTFLFIMCLICLILS